MFIQVYNCHNYPRDFQRLYDHRRHETDEKICAGIRARCKRQGLLPQKRAPTCCTTFFGKLYNKRRNAFERAKKIVTSGLPSAAIR